MDECKKIKGIGIKIIMYTVWHTFINVLGLTNGMQLGFLGDKKNGNKI